MHRIMGDEATLNYIWFIFSNFLKSPGKEEKALTQTRKISIASLRCEVESKYLPFVIATEPLSELTA